MKFKVITLIFFISNKVRLASCAAQLSADSSVALQRLLGKASYINGGVNPLRLKHCHKLANKKRVTMVENDHYIQHGPDWV